MIYRILITVKPNATEGVGRPKKRIETGIDTDMQSVYATTVLLLRDINREMYYRNEDIRAMQAWVKKWCNPFRQVARRGAPMIEPPFTHVIGAVTITITPNHQKVRLVEGGYVLIPDDVSRAHD
jgi:hypothetical protein